MDNEYKDNATQLDVFLTLTDLVEEARPTLESFSTGDDRDDIARYGLCLVLEAAELVNSLPWKRWARHPSDLEKSKEEFADMLCFIGSIVGLFEHLGVSVGDLSRAYIKKINDNRERFATYRLLEGIDHPQPVVDFGVSMDEVIKNMEYVQKTLNPHDKKGS